MQNVRDIFDFIGDEQNARALGIIGAIIAAVALSGWAVFKQYSKSNKESISAPSLEEYRQMLRSEREGLVAASHREKTVRENELQLQVARLDKKLEDIESSYEDAQKQNDELKSRLSELSAQGERSLFIDAATALNQRNLSQAETLFEEFLESIEPQLKDAASAFLGIAMAREERADWPGAAKAYSTSLALNETQYALGQTAKFLWYSGDQVSALKISSRLLELSIEEFGEVSDQAAMARALVAGQLYDLGDIENARSETITALNTLEKIGLKGSCRYYNLLMNIGNITFVDSDLSGAEDFHRRALSGLLENDCDKELVAASRNGLAETLRASGQLVEAGRLLKKNYEEAVEMFGQRHPHTARALNFLAKWEFDDGQHKSALKHLIDALSIQSENLGEFHHNSIAIASNIISISREFPDLQTAESSGIEIRYGAIIDQAIGERAGNPKQAM